MATRERRAPKLNRDRNFTYLLCGLGIFMAVFVLGGIILIITLPTGSNANVNAKFDLLGWSDVVFIQEYGRQTIRAELPGH